MSKGNKYLIPIIGVVIAVTLLTGQSGGYLSQKLMVENNIRERVKEALSKLIDSHKYVINIDVELEILDEVNEQITVFSPRESGKRADITPAEKTADALLRIQRKMIEESQPEPASGYSIGLPIPGFEIDVAGEKSQPRSVTQSTPISPRTMEPMDQPTNDDNAQREMVDKEIGRASCRERV